MAEEFLIDAYVGNPSYSGAGSQVRARATNLGSLAVTYYEPAYFELARNGNLFSMTNTVATAVAPLQVVPTTTAAFVLYNADAVGGKVLVPLFITAFFASGTADTGATLFGQCSAAPITALTANGTGFVSARQRGSGTSIAFGDVSKTVSGGWAALASTNNAAVTTPGAGVTADVRGMFVIPPTYALGLHVLSGAGTSAKCSYAVTYAEIAAVTP